MFENNYPLFSAGRILKTEMLEELRDYPREFFNIRFSDYSDGIISGCDIEVTDNFIVVKKGIIKYGGLIYILTEDKPIRYENNNKLVCLKVRFLASIRDNDFLKNSTEVYIDEEIDKKENEMELCRFKLREGAKLRVDYTSFQDFATEFDTVNIINVPYGAIEGSSLSPKITRYFGEELIKLDLKDSWDIQFACMCIQSKDPIEKSIITNYLVFKINIARKEYSNEDLYYYLEQALRKAKEGNDGKGTESRGRYKRILID